MSKSTQTKRSSARLSTSQNTLKGDAIDVLPSGENFCEMLSFSVLTTVCELTDAWLAKTGRNEETYNRATVVQRTLREQTISLDVASGGGGRPRKLVVCR